jgi:hypothetical protein
MQALRYHITLLACLTLVLPATDAAVCQISSSDTTGTEADQSGLVASLEYLAGSLVRDARAIVTAPARIRTRDLPLIAGGVGSLLLLTTYDDEIRDGIQSDGFGFLDRDRSDIELLGRVGVNQQISGFMFLTGLVLNEKRLKRTGILAWESSAFTVIVTSAMKHAFGRYRPFQDRGPGSWRPFEGASSFPSSHAAQAFSLATVLADEYGAPVAFASYGMATLVALSRMREDQHWASDVVAGGLIGHFMARTLCHLHPSAGDGDTVPPMQTAIMVKGDTALLSLLVTFD